LKESEKLKIFKETLKKAKEGKLFNYDEWLKENGINPNFVNLKNFEYYFWRNPDKMIGNEKFIEKIAGYIGHFLKDKVGLYHIPVIGVKGSGKTLLLRILEDFTNEHETNLAKRVDIINDADWINRYAKKDEKRPSSEKVKIIFIDNCEKVKGIKKILENVQIIYGETVYISSWTPESWMQYKEEMSQFLPVVEDIILSSLQLRTDLEVFHYDYWNFLDHAIKSTMLNERFQEADEQTRHYLLPDFLDLKEFHEGDIVHFFQKYSKGNILISLKLLLACYKKLFLSRESELNEDIIISVAEEMGLKDLDERMSKLSDQHLLILVRILQEIEVEGIRPMMLVKKFGLDKSTITHHLNTLKDLKLIEDKKIGKSKFYKVKENFIPFIQMKILEKYYKKNGV